MDARIVAVTALALIAFASNSILARLALGSGEIDAASFTSVRLIAGAVALSFLVRGTSGAWPALRGSAIGPLALFAYAAPFSFAYLRIGAAVGALVLFGAVQLTMVGWGILRGERPRPRAWAGLVLAAFGLGLLALPAATRPEPFGTALMALAGIAWGIYSLAGRGTTDPLAANARAFLLSAPLALVLTVALRGAAGASTRGFVLAAVSGAVTSGLGYAIWYRAVRGLSATQAAVVQLSVPVIAAIGGVTLLGEALGARIVVSGAAVLGGVALVLSSRAWGSK